MKKTALFLIALTLPHAAHAQLVQRACGGHMPCHFEQLKAGEAAWFEKADTNHDGVVDGAEQAAIWQQYAQDILPACHDMQELKLLKLNHLPTDEQIRKVFDAADANHDGIIDAQEDQQATQRVNAACQLMNDPQVRKMKQMFKQWQQQGGQ